MPYDDARSLIAAAKLRETTVKLCLRGDLLAEHERLTADLDAVPSLTDPATVAIAEQVAALEADIAAAAVVFTLRALPRRDWDALLEANQPRDGRNEAFNRETFPLALVGACLTAPTFTEDETSELFDVLNEGQRDALFGAAWTVNTEAGSVPFSERASVVIRWREQNSKSPDPGASPEASS